MDFCSFPFLFGFLPGFFLLYYWMPNRWLPGWMLIGSLVFYAWGCRAAPWHFAIMCLFVLANLFLAGRVTTGARRRHWLVLGLALDFGLLLYFKYAAFFGNTLRTLVGLGATLSPKAMPLGLSFFTFQAAAFLLDTYWRGAALDTSPVRTGVLFFLFPHATSGPILDAASFLPQLRQPHVTLSRLDTGLREFCIGLGLKVLLADRIGKLWSDVAAIGYESVSTPLAWMALVAYSLQLYFDFYGYSRMAVGLGHMLGLTLPRNFSYPYLARSMTQFWRRWHMSLGAWFRNYLYIPLGGSRAGRWRTVRNLLIVWLATGLWHGASWNFLLWGFALFLLLLVEKAGFGRLLERYAVLGHAYMLLVIPLSWLLFAVSDLGQIGVYLSRLFPFGGNPAGAFAADYIKYGTQYGFLLLIGVLFATPLPRRIYQRLPRLLSALLLIAAFWGCLYCLRRGLNDPFLYFQF